MNASSSEACLRRSSWSTMPFGAAASPICSAVSPVDLERRRLGRLDRDVGSGEQALERLPPAAERTRTIALEACRTNSSMLISAISRPRPITIRCSAVSAISLIRCEETNTVRPSAARPLSRFADPAGSPRVEAVDRLVEHHDLGIAQQRRGDPEALTHTERELARALARHLASPTHLDQLVDAAARRSRASGRARAGGCRPSARCARERASSSAPTSCSGADVLGVGLAVDGAHAPSRARRGRGSGASSSTSPIRSGRGSR